MISLHQQQLFTNKIGNNCLPIKSASVYKIQDITIFESQLINIQVCSILLIKNWDSSAGFGQTCLNPDIKEKSAEVKSDLRSESEEREHIEPEGEGNTEYAK
ncbi:uncharacterized protein KGF55_005258 [Candida pseudojiufengensis]|uniref:uncharacterized protein n=1 Tax=Candida pseudojiufengensis TaxID=497109 RepID=UPI0022246D45|nr:uncharacterized protein KGF55_005258 [Candida pseudojiufengensis]KAI5959614.1 hypothetical protein KGF55_005258 [Candida pseudojiufengensis]